MEEQKRIVEMLSAKKWAIMDMEYIRTSKTHKCIRKLYILADNGYNDMELDFYPCTRYRDLESKYQRSFRFCKAHIHKLSYNPEHQYALACNTVLAKLNTFIVYNNIQLILYKGGTIEKELCKELDIPSYNIECFGGLEKVESHDPQTEVNSYYTQLVEIL